ncbi:hypothetical protein DFJ77DRAFT_463238 [Powellomyces hirtus]|nr:hypothetical protein DFJ77DRAFT_463238 [Powellomyces hirtus]
MELRKQVEPREEDIIVLSTQIKEMDDELQSYHKHHDDLSMNMQDLLMRLRAAQNEAQAETWHADHIQASLWTIQADVANIMTEIEDMNKVKRVLISTHHKHSVPLRALTPPAAKATSMRAVLRPSTPPPAAAIGASAATATAATAANASALPVQEDTATAAQRDHLERTIATLETRLQKEDAKRYKENLKILKENTLLLAEINLLRKDIKSSERRAARLTQLKNGPAKRLTQTEYDYVNPDQHLLRDSLLAKTRNPTMPGAMKLLKGNIPSLAGLPPV